MFLVKGVLKIYSKFTGEHPCRSVISIKLQSNFTDSERKAPQSLHFSTVTDLVAPIPVRSGSVPKTIGRH